MVALSWSCAWLGLLALPRTVPPPLSRRTCASRCTAPLASADDAVKGGSWERAQELLERAGAEEHMLPTRTYGAVLNAMSRRAALAVLPAVATALPSLARAAEDVPTSTLPPSLLSIVKDTLSSDPDAQMRPLSLVQRPAYGVETSDVFYPDWFLGRWSVRSTLREVCCRLCQHPNLEANTPTSSS